MWRKSSKVAANILLTIREIIVQESIDFVTGRLNGQHGTDWGKTLFLSCSTTLPCRSQLRAHPCVVLETPRERKDVCGFFMEPGTEKGWNINRQGGTRTQARRSEQPLPLFRALVQCRWQKKRTTRDVPKTRASRGGRNVECSNMLPPAAVSLLRSHESDLGAQHDTSQVRM